MATQLMKGEVAEEKSCSYCIQELKDLTDPRQLPCGLHIACMGCLKPTVAVNLTLKCEICRTRYPGTNIDKLKKVEQLATVKIEAGKSEPVPPCDRCINSKPNDATRYCPTCVAKICEKHQQYHDGYFGKSHQTVDILEYQQKESTYCEVRRCDKHPEEIVKLACTICYLPSCVDCIGSSSRQARNHNHNFRPMAEIDKSLRAHYRGHLTVLNSALAANSVQGKKIDQSIDEIGENCEKMTKNIKQKTEEQIKFITEQSENLVKRVVAYKTTSTGEYESRMKQYTDRETKIKSLTKEVVDFLGDADMKKLSDGIQTWDYKVQAVTQSSPPADLTRRNLLIGRKRKMEIDFDDTRRETYINQSHGYLSSTAFFPSQAAVHWSSWS